MLIIILLIYYSQTPHSKTESVFNEFKCLNIVIKANYGLFTEAAVQKYTIYLDGRLHFIYLNRKRY